MAYRPISGLAAEQITIGGWVPANRLFLTRHVVQHPPYEGIPIIGTRDDGVHFPLGFVLALLLSLGYAVVKGSIHNPLNKIQFLIRQKVHRFTNVNEGNHKAMPPRLRNHAVDSHEIHGVGLFQAPIQTVEFRWPSLRWHGLYLSVLIDTLSSR